MRASLLTYNRLPVSFECKDFNDELGTFVGFASVYGVEDLQGDIVDKGAFSKTIQERPVVKILFNHNSNLPIGVGTVEDSDAGLILKARLNLDVQSAREVYSNLKKGVLDSLSIGYDVVKKAMAGGIRHLKELKLYEVSVVTFPANQYSQVIGVKGADLLALPLGDLLALTLSRADQTAQEVKAGAVLSAVNIRLLDSALEVLTTLRGAAQKPVENTPVVEEDAEKSTTCQCGHTRTSHPENGKCGAEGCACTGYMEAKSTTCECQHPRTSHPENGACSVAACACPGYKAPMKSNDPADPKAADPEAAPSTPGSKSDDVVEPDLLHSMRELTAEMKSFTVGS